MQIIIACLIIIATLNNCQVSGLSDETHAQDVAQQRRQAISLQLRLAPSSDEEETGLKIASKLESVMREKPRSSWGLGLMSTTHRLYHKPSKPRYHKMDCQLVLDSSGSITSSQFELAKRATKVVVDYINQRAPISSHGSRIGLIEYSSTGKTHVEFKFPDHNSAWGVKNAIDRVDYDNGGWTATALALQMAKTQIDEYGKRGNAKLVWLMSDGNANTGSPLPAAKALKEMGATVCAIGVGNRINMNEIRAIASPGCAFKVSSFTSYVRVMKIANAEGGSVEPQEDSPSIGADFFKDIRFR